MKRLKNLVLFSSLLILISSLSAPLTADFGSITPGFGLYEPGQYAIVAWNNGYEILYLSTYLYTPENGMIIQVMPLPSIPEVYLGSNDTFNFLSGLASAYEEQWKALGSSYSSSLINEVVLTAELGPHNITVFYVKNETNFVDTIYSYASSNGISTLQISQVMLNDVDYYIGKGYRYFCVDIINVTDHDGFTVPIIFKFKSSTIYYPMEISSTNQGTFSLHMFFLTLFPINIRQLNKFGIEIGWTKIVSRDIVSYADPRLLSIFMPWHVSFYLTYVYGENHYSNLDSLGDIELAPPLSYFIYQTVPLINIVLVAGLMILDYKRERIIINSRGNLLVVYINLILSILIATNLFTVVGPDNFILPLSYSYYQGTIKTYAGIIFSSYDLANLLALLASIILSISLISTVRHEDYIRVSKFKLSNKMLQKYSILVFVPAVIILYSITKLLQFILMDILTYYDVLITLVFSIALLMITLIVITAVHILLFIKIKSTMTQESSK